MYLVVNGRLRVFNELGEHETMVGEVGCGESVGERGLLTEEPRFAPVVAARDTNLVKLPKTLIGQHPQLMARIARLMARRMQGGDFTTSTNRKSAPFALLPISPGVPLVTFAERLTAALRTLGPTLHFDAQACDRTFGKDGAAQLHGEHPLNLTLTSWLNERETEHQYIIYQADNSLSAWTQRCLRQADRILLVTLAENSPAPGELESYSENLP